MKSVKNGLQFVLDVANMILACIVGIMVGIFALVFDCLANAFEKWTDTYKLTLAFIANYVDRLKNKLFPVDQEEEP